VVSEALRSELNRMGVDNGRIEVLPNGVDLELFDAAGRARGRAGPTRLLVVGHLKPGKGHRAVIEALPKLPDCELEIAGDGPLRSELERSSDACGVRARVRFLGSVAHSRLAEHYRAADALIL